MIKYEEKREEEKVQTEKYVSRLTTRDMYWSEKKTAKNIIIMSFRSVLGPMGIEFDG